MATDYYALLSRAIGSLPENDQKSRHGIYDRARQMIENHFRTNDQRSPDDRKAELSALEEAIWRIEIESNEPRASAVRTSSSVWRALTLRIAVGVLLLGGAGVAVLKLNGESMLAFWEPASMLHGEVVDNFGKPLSDVKVAISNTTFETTTDANGKYRLSYIPGRFELQLEKQGYFPAALSLEPATKTVFPVKQIQVWKRPPALGLWVLGADDYATSLNGCKVDIKSRYTNSGHEGHYEAQGTPTRLKLADHADSIFTFVDHTPFRMQVINRVGESQFRQSVAPLLRIFKLKDGARIIDFHNNRIDGTYISAIAEIPTAPFGRWFRAPLDAGTYAYILWNERGSPEMFGDGPCFLFRVE